MKELKMPSATAAWWRCRAGSRQLALGGSRIGQDGLREFSAGSGPAGERSGDDRYSFPSAGEAVARAMLGESAPRAACWLSGFGRP
jgi:hypothetical protein